ncbi:MAG TPA: TetR/AcrR family transcriptional regulator [Victivallales bacterium]|nr:TetR/AcrR family transcriptional regulator [Victivallales bacterium]
MVKSQHSSADKTRAKILSSAFELFTEKGFTGTSIRDIANDAKVNINLIYHHYLTKKKLWESVLEDSSSKYSIDVKVENYDFTDLKKLLIKLTDSYFNFFKSNPKILRLINWVKMEEDKNIIIHQNYMLKIKPVLLKMVEAKLINLELDIDFICLFVLSSILSVFENKSIVFQNVEFEIVQRNYMNFIVDRIYNSIKAN